MRALRSGKGRRESGHFLFEGPTLLREAHAGSFPIEAVYSTVEAYDDTPVVRELEDAGTPVFIVDPASLARISDLASPAGIVAVSPQRLFSENDLLSRGSLVLVLADVGDPSNAGTLLRSADAFGCSGVVFGSLGVEPFHPKVVRGSMGAVFRLEFAIGEPAGVAAAARAAGALLLGLTAEGEPLAGEDWELPAGLVVGHERRGLGRWKGLCDRFLGIPMEGPAESLSAAVAGSIALYEASRHICQESTQRPKSQDYQG